MRRLGLAAAFVLLAGLAHAQSPYVAGTVGADVTRVSHASSNLAPAPSAGSEVFSGSLRAGTSLGERWGVELEFVRSARSRGQTPATIRPLVTWTDLTPALPSVLPGNVPLPFPVFETDVRQSHLDFDTVAWVRQRVSDRADLVVAGGVAFSRQRVDITQTFPTAIRALLPGGGSFRTTLVEYGTRPLVGAEARIGLTSHVRLIPGIRLQGLSAGWLIRPYAGLGWFF